MPNEPHRLCLVEAGDYVREHATLYVTSGGLIYLVYFFFIFKQKENRLKVWVVVFNILLLIPLFSIILGLNSAPYVRWFFIPYMLNIYAMAMAMDHMDFKLGNHNIFKIIPTIILITGITALFYVIIATPEIFIHYKNDETIFLPLLLISVAFNLSGAFK